MRQVLSIPLGFNLQADQRQRTEEMSQYVRFITAAQALIDAKQGVDVAALQEVSCTRPFGTHSHRQCQSQTFF